MGVLPGSAFPDIQKLTPVRDTPVIRLDRAMKVSITKAASAAQFSNIELNNNAPQNAIIVVRAIAIGPVAALPAQCAYTQVTIGGSSSIGVPLVPDRGLLPGKIQASFLNTLPTPDWIFWQQTQPVTPSDLWPIAVLPSGWSWRVASQVSNQLITVSILWEVLTPEEYTESYGSYA